LHSTCFQQNLAGYDPKDVAATAKEKVGWLAVASAFCGWLLLKTKRLAAAANGGSQEVY